MHQMWENGIRLELGALKASHLHAYLAFFLACHFVNYDWIIELCNICLTLLNQWWPYLMGNWWIKCINLRDGLINEYDTHAWWLVCVHLMKLLAGYIHTCVAYMMFVVSTLSENLIDLPKVRDWWIDGPCMSGTLLDP